MKWFGLIICSMLFSPVYLLNASAATSSGQRIQGIVEPFRFADISPEISGRIVEISVPEGKMASRGDTIIKVEFSEDLLAVERARLVAENKAELKAARLKVETTKLEYDATKMVYDSTQAVSQEELWGKKYQYETALAEFELLSVQKERELVDYRIAQSRLSTHFIIAPYQCIVASIKLRELEHCKAAEPLVSIVDASRCRLVAYVPLNASKELVNGIKVNIQLDTKNGVLKKEGIVEFISPVVDPASNLFTVKVRFENSDRSVNPGVAGYLLIGE
jgi:RND family efflux transporter MFP subunit